MSELQPALPKRMYVDSDQFTVERDRALFTGWFCVGRLDDLGLDRPGRLAVVDVVGESVLVTNDREGTLHAAYNVCRHRGSQVVPVDGEPPPACDVAALRCPYHSWTYDLAGRLLKAPHTEDVEDFDAAAFSLTPVGVRTWAGFGFVHLTPDAGCDFDARHRRRSPTGSVATRWPTWWPGCRTTTTWPPTTRCSPRTTTSATTAVRSTRS